MLSSATFEMLDTLLSRVRDKPHLSFGGMALIFAGEFMQLRPVCGPRGAMAFCACFRACMRICFREAADS